MDTSHRLPLRKHLFNVTSLTCDDGVENQPYSNMVMLSPSFLTPYRVFWNDFLPWKVFLPHTWVRFSHNSLHLVGGLHKITCKGGGDINYQIKHSKHFLLISQPPNYFPLSKISKNPFRVKEGRSKIIMISSSTFMSRITKPARKNDFSYFNQQIFHYFSKISKNPTS